MTQGENQERLLKIKIEGTPERKMRELAAVGVEVSWERGIMMNKTGNLYRIHAKKLH